MRHPTSQLACLLTNINTMQDEKQSGREHNARLKVNSVTVTHLDITQKSELLSKTIAIIMEFTSN